MTGQADAPAPTYGPTALLTPANAITVGRIVGTVALGVLILAGVTGWALAVFVVLALSDQLDGIVARRQGPTRSGAFLDPLADKVFLGTVLIALGIRGEVSWVAVALILGREVVISVFRAYAVRRGATVPASVLGKAKTFVTTAALGLILIPDPGVQSVGTWVLWVAVVLTLVSGADYLVNARHLIREGQARHT
ncbi:MAG: CDP-alcohol phosphatidyltransferase family protein [Acidimicrobiia bacterium]